VLNFGKINTQFKKLKETFVKFDTDDSNTIEIAELHEVVNSLCNTNKASQEDVVALFNAADREHGGHLDFKAFLVCLALGYVLEKIPQQNAEGKEVTMTEGALHLSKVFEYVIDAFLAFDTDASGYIEKAEVMKMFGTTPSASKHAHRTAGSQSVIGKERWAQMDWDHDGRITFKEFLLAFSTWTGLDDDDDDE
jgi:calcium-binding protein CML